FATVNFTVPAAEVGVSDAPPDQVATVRALANASPLRYVQGYEASVPLLVDGTTYYAVVDPTDRGLVRLAATLDQARASDPAVQMANPTLTFSVPSDKQGDPPTIKSVEIAAVLEPSTLVFMGDPGVPDGSTVTYRAVPGRPIAGLSDGLSYLAYRQTNPDFDATVPQFFYELRSAATAEAIRFNPSSTIETSTGTRLPFEAVDTESGLVALELPTAPRPVATAVSPGGTVTITDVPAGSVILRTAATGGTFLLQADSAGNTLSTGAIVWNASSDAVAAAVNTLGLTGVTVTRAHGRGTLEDPWLLVGEGLTELRFDSSSLDGGGMYGEFTVGGLRAIAVTGSTTTFSLSVDVGGTTRTTASLAATASPSAVAAALGGVPGLQATSSFGRGTADSPWLVDVRLQPLASGDPVVYRDAYGAETLGLIDGRTYYAVVRPVADQVRPGAVIVGFAASREAAVGGTSSLVPLDTWIQFGEPVATVLSGRSHTLGSTVAASVRITANLIARDAGLAASKNGNQPSFRDRMRGDMALSAGSGYLLALIASAGASLVTKNYKADVNEAVNGNLNGQQVAGNGAASPTSMLGLSAAFSLVSVTRTVRTIIGDQANIVTPGSILADSGVIEKFRTEVQADVAKPRKTDYGVALAINLGFVDTLCQTVIRSNARLTGGAGVTIHAGSSYPFFNRVFDGTWNGFLPDSATLAGKYEPLLADEDGLNIPGWIQAITEIIGMPFQLWRIRDGFHETGATVKADQKNHLEPKAQPNLDAVVAKAFAGSLQLFWLDNQCEAIVEDGVQINQDTSVASGSDQPVNVTAGSTMMQVSIPMVKATVSKVTSGAGFGVSVLTLGETTRAVIGGSNTLAKADNVKAAAARADVAAAGPTRVTFGDLGLTVDAVHWGLVVMFVKGGSQATDWGISGSASVIVNRGRAHRVEAAIEAPASGVEIRSRPGLGGTVAVRSADHSYLVPVAGSINSGAEKIVGVSTAIALLDRDVIARIGAESADAVAGGVELEVAGSVTLTAGAGGVISPLAVASSRKSAANTYESEGGFFMDEATGIEVRRRFTGDNAIQVDRFGIGVSGAVAISSVDDKVIATVNHSGRMASASAGRSDVPFAVLAENDTILLANTGGLATRTVAGEEKVSTGLSGAVSVIIAGSEVEASLRRAVIDAFRIDVAATNARRIGTVAASGAGGAVGGAGSLTVNFAGSVAVNALTTRTSATVDRVKGTNLAGARVAATSRDLVWAVAGSFVGNVSSILVRSQYQLGNGGKPAQAAENGRSLAVGASVALNDASATTRATISASDLLFGQGSLDVHAADSSTVITASGGGSFVSTGGTAETLFAKNNNAGSSLAGFVALATVAPTVEAAIIDSTVTMGATGDVSVLATTTQLLVTASGGFVLNRDGSGTLSASVGAAVTVVNSTARGSARVERSKVTVPRGRVRVRSTYGNPDEATWKALDPLLEELNAPEAGTGAVWSFAVGAVASDSSFTAAASVNVTSLQIHQTALVADDSTVSVSAGSVEVTAINEARLRTVAGSVSITAFTSDRSVLSAGAAVLSTRMAGETRASIESSSVTAGTDSAVETSGRVAVTAADRPDILAIAASGVMSGEIALSTALAFSDLTGRSVLATITGTPSRRSTVSASNAVSVLASEETNLTSIAGQVAIPATKSAAASAGAAGSVNSIGVDITAVIEHSSVTSDAGDVTIQTRIGGAVRSWAVGVSGALSGRSGSGVLGTLPVSFVGAGSFALNTVVRRSTTAIRGRATVTARSLAVTAEDAGGIFAVAGALAVQASGKLVSLAAGVSVANNEIGTAEPRSLVKAIVDDSTVTTTGGDAAITATARPEITSWTIAGTGQVAKGDGVAVGLSGAGAGNTNRLAIDTLAAITGSATVTSQGSVLVVATDASKVDSNAGGAGLGVVLGEAATVGVTVGAARGLVEITSTVRAAIETGVVAAVGGVSLTAESRQQVAALAFGVGINVAASAAGVGVSAAGSGAASTVRLQTSTSAEIVSAKATAGAAPGRSGSVVLEADDTPVLKTSAGAGSLSFAYGTGAGVGVAPGIVLADTTLTNTVSARIGNTGKPAPTVTASGAGRVVVDSRSAATVETFSMAAAVSAAFSTTPFASLAIAVAYAASKPVITNTVTAAIVSGDVTGASVHLRASDAHDVLTTVGVVAGVVAYLGASVGASTAEATTADTLSATITGGTVTARAGDVTVEAGSGNRLDTRTVATAVSIAIGGGGTAARAVSKDTSSATANVTAATIRATGLPTDRRSGFLQVFASGATSLDHGSVVSRVEGGSVAAGITVGRVHAESESRVSREASVGADTDLSSVAGLDLQAAARPQVKATSFAVDVAGVAAVQANESVAKVGGTTKAFTGSGVTLPGEVRIKASATTEIDVDQQGGSGGGILGYGGNTATARSEMVVEAALGTRNTAGVGGRVNLLWVTAQHSDDSDVHAMSGAGSIGGAIADTKAELTDATKTSATMGAASPGSTLNVGTLVVVAERSQSFATRADSYYGGAVVGIGMPKAAFTTTASAETRIAPGAAIDAAGPVVLRSDNVVVRTGTGYAARVAGGGIISAGGNANSGSTNKVTTTSRVTLGNNASITRGSASSLGGISILPTTDIRISDSVGTWGGGGVAVSVLESKTTATANTEVVVGDLVTLESWGDLTVGTTAVLDVRNVVEGGSVGALGVAKFNAATAATTNQTITFGRNATVTSGQNLKIVAGEHDAAVTPSRINVVAKVDAWIGGAITTISVSAPASIANNTAVSFGERAAVSSGSDLTIGAIPGEPDVDAGGAVTYYDIQGALESLFGGENVKHAEDKKQEINTSKVDLGPVASDGTRGSFIAGADSEVAITIPATATGGTIDGVPYHLRGQPIRATFDAAFDPRAYVEQNFPDDAGAILRAAVPSVKGGWKIDPISVSGGSISILGDTLSGDAAMAAKVGRITVINDSQHHLVVDALRIANITYRGVRITGSSGGTIDRPGGWTVSADDAMPTITLSQTYSKGLDGSGYGPALFLANPASNPRGQVTISNARGSLGVLGTLAAKSVDIRVPLGATVFYVKGAKHVGGPPGTSQNATGGDIATLDARLMDANKALSYAINALFPGAVDEAALNALVYPTVTETIGPGNADRFTRLVFWGAGAPGVNRVPGDVSLGTTQALMALFRTDPVTNPFAIDGGYLPRLQKLPTSFTATSVPASAGSEAIRASQIAIYADTININGDVVVGDTDSPNRSVIVPTTLQTELSDYQAEWRDGRQVNPLYRIAVDKLQRKEAGDVLLGVTFDARTGELVVDDADIAVGTRLTLVGKIINTSAGTGRIRVESGGGGVSIENRTPFTIATGSISTPGTGLSTTLRIVDTLQPEAVQQTLYRYVGDEILVYRGPASADLLAGAPSGRLTGSAIYQPKTDVRWEWTRTAYLERNVSIGVSEDGSVRSGVTGWVFVNPREPWRYGSDGDPTSGRVVAGDGADPAFLRTLSATINGVSPIYHTSKDGQGRVYDWPTEVSLTVTDSVRADHPIAIVFKTGQAAGVRIDSTGGVTLRGPIESSTVVIHAFGGTITAASDGARITAEVVTLQAGSSIGLEGRALMINTGLLSAQADTGSIFIAANTEDPERGVTLARVAAISGGITSITAGGDLLAAAADPSRPIDYSVAGGGIILVSRQGGIGTVSAPIRTHVTPLDAPHGVLASPRARLDATSAKGVSIRNLRGDLLVGTVTSTGGDVSISTEGSLYDAHSWTVNASRQAEIDRILRDLGMADTDAAISRAVATFEAAVRSRYTEYWALRNDGVVFNGRLQLRAGAYDRWAIRTAAYLKLPAGVTPTSQQILDHAADAFTKLEAFFSRTVSGTWRNLPGFVAYDANWTYTATQVQREQLIADLGLDARPILLRMRVDLAESLRPWDPAVRVGNTVNVSGVNVMLVATSGTVGWIAEPVTVLGSSLRSGAISDAEWFALSLAGRRGDATRVTGGIRLNILRPIVVAVGAGRLDADGSSGVAIAQPAETLRLGRINSTQGTVDIAAQGSIVSSGSGSGIQTRTPSPSSVTTTLFSRTGSIGTVELPIAVGGGVVSAGVLDPLATIHITSPQPVVPEDPPKPQPNEPGEPKTPERQEVDRIDMRPGDVTVFNLGGTTPGSATGGHDQIVVIGQAVLDGAITVRLAPGYAPRSGDRFTVMTYGSVAGRFVEGRGLFGLVDDVWFEIEQTGDATTPGAITLVAREFLPGVNAALTVADGLGFDASGIRNGIGMFLNQDYFGIDLQITFSGGFTYGELEIEGRVTLRYNKNPDRANRYEAAVNGTVDVGDTFHFGGEMLVSVGAGNGAETSLALLAEDVDLDVAVGGTTLGATRSRIGLLASDAGIAFEASAGIYANLSSDLSLYAEKIFVSYNGTAVDYTGVMFALGGVDYTFEELGANTFSIGVTGGEVLAGGFLQAEGSFAIRGFSQQLVLAGGTTVTADVLTIGGANLGGFAGARGGTATETGVRVVDLDFGVALITERAGAGRRWLTAEGDGQSAAVVGLKGVSGSLTAVAFSLNLGAADGSIVDYSVGKTVLTVGTGMTFTADGSKGRILRASGTASFEVEGGLSLGGTVGISLAGSDVVVVGSGINAVFGPADAKTYLRVTGASFGLVATGSGTALELGGGLSAALAGFASVRADRAFAQFTSADVAITAGSKLDTGTASYTFVRDIAKGTHLFSVEGLEARMADFVTIAGDFGFLRTASGLVAASANASARLTVGDTVRVGVTGGTAGFRVTPAGKVALQVTGGTAEVSLGSGFAAVSATGVGVVFNTTGVDVDETVRVSLGGHDVAAPIQVERGVTAVVVTGFRGTLSNAVTITGDFGMRLSRGALVAASANASALVTAGSVLRAGVTGAVLGLRVNANGSLALQSSGGQAVVDLGSGFVSVTSADAGITFNNTGAAVSQKVSIDVGNVSVMAAIRVDPGVLSLWVRGLEAHVAGFAKVSGDFGIQTSGSGLVAVSTNASVLLLAGSTVRIGLERATVGFRVNPDGTSVLQATGGTAVLDLGPGFLRVTAMGLGVAFNSTASDVKETVSVGLEGRTISASLNVAGQTASMVVMGLEAQMAGFVTLQGTFGLRLSGEAVVAASSNASAQLVVGSGVRVGLKGATVGLRLNADGTVALQATGGSSVLNPGPGFVTVTATGVGVGFNNTGEDVEETLTVAVGGVGVSAPLKLARGTTSVVVTGFDARIAGFVRITGDFGMRVSGAGLVAASANASAWLTAGEVLRVGVAGGVVGMRVNGDGTLALQVTGGTAGLDLGAGFATATATGVGVGFNNTGKDVGETLTVAVGGVGVSAPLKVAHGTRSVWISGLRATVADRLEIHGDLAARSAEGGLELAGRNLSARWDTGGGLTLGVDQGSVALVVETSGGWATRITGTPRVPVPEALRSTIDLRLRDLTFAYNSTGKSFDRMVTVGEVAVPLVAAPGTMEAPAFSVSGSVEVTIAAVVRLSGSAGFSRSVDATTQTTRVMVGLEDLEGNAGTDSYTISGGRLGLVFLSDSRTGGSLGYALEARLQGRAAGDIGSAEIGLRVRRNTTALPVDASVPIADQFLSVRFSAAEVAAPSGEAFYEFALERVAIRIGTLVIEGNYQTASTTPDGVSTTRVTDASLAFGDPQIFRISAKELLYKSYTQGRTLGGIRYEGRVEQVQITEGRIDISDVLSLQGTFSLVWGVPTGQTAPRMTLAFARTSLTVRRTEGGNWLEIGGNGQFTYVDGVGLSLDRFEVTDFEVLGSGSAVPQEGTVRTHGDAEGFDPETGDLLPAAVAIPITLKLGPVTLRNPSLAVQDLDLRWTAEGLVRLRFNVVIGVGTAEVRGGTDLGVTITDSADEDPYGVAGSFGLEVDLDPLKRLLPVRWGVVGFQLVADQARADLGSLISFETLGMRFDLGAAADQPLLVFQSATVLVNAGPLQISGSADHFSILGSGAFRADTNFEVRLSVLPGAGKDLGMPSWLSVRVETLGLRWRSINEAPLDVVLTLSASVVGIEGLPGASFSGFIEGLQIDLGLLRQGRAPIVELGGIGVTIRADAFGGKIEGGLVGGLVRIGADGQRIGPDAPASTPVVDRVLFLGVQGGFEMAGLAGFSIRFALSELGPLGVLVSVNSPVGIPIDPTLVTGLAIGSFTAGVDFYSTLPSITTVEELRNPSLSGRQVVSADQWSNAVQDQVAAQYRAIRDNPALGGFFSAFSAPMVITGSGRLFTNYLSPSAFNADLEIRISTDGKFLAIGTFNFLDGGASIAGRLYGDLTRIAKGEGRFLFLVTMPDQVQLLEFGGGLEFGFRDATGAAVSFGKPVTPTPGGDSAVPALDLVLATPDPSRSLDVVQWSGSRTLGLRLVSLGGASVGSVRWNDLPNGVTLIDPQGNAMSLGAPTEIREGVATFRLPDGFQITAGSYQVTVAAGAFRNLEGVASTATTRGFIVHGTRVTLPTTLLRDGIDVAVLNGNRWIDLLLNPTTGATLDSAELSQARDKFSMVVGGERIAIQVDPDPLPGGAFRFWLPEGVTIPVGEHQIVAAAGAVRDSNGNTNLETVIPLRVQGVRMTLLGVSGGLLPVDLLNRQGYLDVLFTPTQGAAVQDSTILDPDPEWTLVGPAAAGVTILQSGVEALGGGVFRYRFEGRFVEGGLQFETLAGSVTDSGGQGALSGRTDLRVAGLQAVLVEPGPTNVLSTSAIQSAGRLLFQFNAPFGTTLDMATILDEAPEVRLTGTASSGVVLSGVGQRVEIDGQSFIEYRFTGTFGTGEVGVEVVSGSWSDTAGNLGQAGRFGFDVAADASTFFIHIDGFVTIKAAGVTPDLDGDGAPDPLLRVRGGVTLEFAKGAEGDGAQLSLAMTGSVEVFGVGAVGAAAGSFTVA
ncbi:MAG: hypothetical protein RLZ45_1268, partial [Verrucomicrobiota bacterium]